jgi:sodium/potassium-transporting ATPase subunit alpha
MHLVRCFIGETTSTSDLSLSYVTMVFMQYGGLLAVRNRRVSILQSNPLWGPRRNFAVPLGMIATALIAVVNLYGPGLQRVFRTAPIPGMFWALPFSFALGILCMDEARKLIVRTYPKVSLYSQPSRVCKLHSPTRC